MRRKTVAVVLGRLIPPNDRLASAVAACISVEEMQAATAAACLSFDGISRPSTTATVFPLTAVCVRLARDQNLGLVGQGGRGAFQFMRQMTQSWNFRNIVRLFTNIKYVRTLGGEGVKYPENFAVGFDVKVKRGSHRSWQRIA